MNRWMRVIAGLLAAVLLCVSLSACDLSEYIRFIAPTEKGIPEDNDQEYTSIGEPSYMTPVGYFALSSRYSYQQLSEGQQMLYDALLENMDDIYPEKDDVYGYRMKQVIVDGYQLEEAEIRVTVRAILDDNPYLFWMSQTYTMLNDPDLNYTAVQLYSEFGPDEVVSMKKELDDAIDSFYSTVSEGLSTYEREKLVHDYLVDLCEYDDADKDRTELTVENIKSHSVYGALVEHLCVCEGYGMAMQLLLNGIGVECVTLTGDAYDSTADEDEDDGTLHLWNAVKVDGNWYQVDITWDDSDEVFQRYDYFNLDDETFFEDHTLSKTAAELDDDAIVENGTEDMNLFIPTCDSTDYNYYIYECPHLKDYSGEGIIDALYTTAMAEGKYFTFYVDPSLDYDGAVESLFVELPQYFFDYIDDVNDRLYDLEIDNSNIHYYSDASRRSVTVVLSYY